MKASLYSVPPLPDQPELEEVNTMLRRIRPANLGAHMADRINTCATRDISAHVHAADENDMWETTRPTDRR